MRRVDVASLAFLGALATPIAQGAGDLNRIDDLLQPEFKSLSKDLGGALAYRSITPAEPLGVTGFDIGLSVSATRLEHVDLWNTATAADDFSSTLYVPRLHVIKGLPFGIDVGAFYTSVPSTNIQLWGGEIKYAILEGSAATPALAARGSFTKLEGVDQLEFSTMGLDLSVSKGLAIFTPYAGIGVQRVNSEPQEEAAHALEDETFTQTRMFAGVNMNFALLNTALELDQTGDVMGYTLKLGLRF
jgi:hypothetical protein